MLRVRHAPFKSLRRLHCNNTRRAFSDASQSQPSDTTPESDVHLRDVGAPVASEPSTGSVHQESHTQADNAPELVFGETSPDHASSSFLGGGPLLLDLALGKLPKNSLSHKLLSKLEATKHHIPVPPLTRSHTRKGNVKGRKMETPRVRGLLSPFDRMRLQDASRSPSELSLKPPVLQHELDRVLTNPGVHWLTEPRTSHDNFPSYLKEVPSASEFAFQRLRGFVPSSQDDDMHRLAKQNRCSFVGSTSSLTGMLSQIYLLLCEHKPVDLSTLSAHYQSKARNFTQGQRMPISVSLKYKDGLYSTDSDVDHLSQMGSSVTLLSQLGMVMEKFFTMDLSEFKSAFMKGESETFTHQGEAYRYAIHNKFMMRAQLDCHSPVLPGTGVFDIKTRAAVAVRLNLPKYRDNSNYRIYSIQGPWMSFEKEYYDLIRSAFLKYSFQARIGNMDGVFVAYHNTHEIFGFQYIPLEEMDRRLFGHDQGHRIFTKCISLLEVLFEEITTHFPKQSVKCTWETASTGKVMRIWIEPAEWREGEQKPIVQLNVTLSHYLGSLRVSGKEAVTSRNGGWTVSYQIAKSSLSQREIYKRRRGAFNTQLRVFQYRLDVNERIERREDIDLTDLKPLSFASKRGGHWWSPSAEPSEPSSAASELVKKLTRTLPEST